MAPKNEPPNISLQNYIKKYPSKLPPTHYLLKGTPNMTHQNNIPKLTPKMALKITLQLSKGLRP